MLPHQFGPFRIVRKLGEGGMGTVYLVEHPDHVRPLALKVPNLRDDDPKRLERFRREARLAQSVHHPYMPGLRGRREGGVHYPDHALRRGGSPSRGWSCLSTGLKRAAELVRRLALALHVLHAKQVVHRDLKPHNVMVKAGDEPV